jgi:hypothetical protein
MAKKPAAKPSTPRKKTPNKDGVCTFARYSRSLGEEICQRIAGGESWISFCNTGRMPSYATLYAWRDRYPEFRAGLARARDMAADYRAERALQVAEAATSATVQADRLRVATLMKHAALGAPRRWGARAETQETPGETLTIYVRRFEKVVRPDGSAFVREIKPEGGQ